MNKPERYHPLTMLVNLWEFIKSLFFFAILLFVLNYGSDSMIVYYGRIIFYIAIVVGLFNIVYNWFIHTYQLVDESFYLYEGLFNKTERHIPFSKVHNVKRNRSFLHRLFKVTSISFETSMSGPDAAVKFKVISFVEAKQFELLMKEKPDDVLDSSLEIEGEQEVKDQRTLHFSPTRKDTIKAAFTSFSFLLLLPILFTFYIKLDDVFDLDSKAEGVFNTIISSWWFIALVVILILAASLTFGFVRAFIKYGKYEITSDRERIFITRGMINEVSFSIAKDKVQAIEITQPFIKRVLGLAEVKLISAGSLGDDIDQVEANSLYPFLPVKKAYVMIEELLPTYEVSTVMNRLPKKSLVIRLLRPSWLWIILTIGLVSFKPTVFTLENGWWLSSLAVLILIIGARYLNFVNTRFTIREGFIQFRSGSLGTVLFISKREKVVEIEVSRNKIQQLFGLASINMINRAKPVHHTGMTDVPLSVAHDFYNWYANRLVDITLE